MLRPFRAFGTCGRWSRISLLRVITYMQRLLQNLMTALTETIPNRRGARSLSASSITLHSFRYSIFKAARSIEVEWNDEIPLCKLLQNPTSIRHVLQKKRTDRNHTLLPIIRKIERSILKPNQWFQGSKVARLGLSILQGLWQSLQWLERDRKMQLNLLLI